MLGVIALAYKEYSLDYFLDTNTKYYYLENNDPFALVNQPNQR